VVARQRHFDQQLPPLFCQNGSCLPNEIFQFSTNFLSIFLKASLIVGGTTINV